MGNTVSSASAQDASPLYDRQTFPRTEREKKLVPKCNTIDRSDNRNQNGSGNQESSRMLFLMYLINRTWNVVGGKRWVEWTWHAIFAPKLKMETEEIQKRFTFIATLTCFMFSRLFFFLLHRQILLLFFLFLKFQHFSAMTTSTRRDFWKMETKTITRVITGQNVQIVVVAIAKMNIAE